MDEITTKRNLPEKLLSYFRKRKFLSTLLFLISVIFIVVFLFFLSLPDVRFLINKNPDTTSMIDKRIEEYKNKGTKFIILHKWVKFDLIPELLKKTILVSEDINFYHHSGIDYFELKESIKMNLSKGKKVRGGSTITQQLAKNLYLSSEKTYSRKIKEFFIAKKLEKHLGKKRILSIYMNVIEFGRGIFGIQAASEKFFDKSVCELTLSEMIRIVAVIPKPLKVSPLSNSEYLKWRANLLLKRLLKIKYITEEQFNNTSFKFR